MNRRPDRFFCLVAGYCFSVAVLAASLVQIARAQEAVPPAPPVAVCNGSCPIADHDHPVCAGPCDPAVAKLIDRATRALTSEFGAGVMFHVTVPPPPGNFLQSNCPHSTCCEELMARIGIHQHQANAQRATQECDINVNGDLPQVKRIIVLERVHLQPGHIIDTRNIRDANSSAMFLQLGCPLAAAGECHCADQATCGSECAAAEANDCKCCPCAAESDAVACTREQGQKATLIIKRATHHLDINHHDPLQLMHHVAELMAAKAGAEAALEVRKQADEQIGELFETLAEVIADNAALDARIEGLTEQRMLNERLVELAAENAKLKAHVELVVAQAEATRASHVLALENERLKHRLADLEQKHADEASRTATRIAR